MPHGLPRFDFDESGAPRYEQLARHIEQAIGDGLLVPGDRLPTVRQLAHDLAVSATTISSCFELLASRGLIRPEVGRGTFIARQEKAEDLPTPAAARPFQSPAPRNPPRMPWRRRALMSVSGQLRSAYPDALECSTGRPDPGLLPLPVIRRAWESAIETVTARDLQYAGTEAIEPLARVLVAAFAQDAIPARTDDLIVGSSAQQFMSLALDLVAAACDSTPVVAVEEPGYPTVMDTFEQKGARLIGVAVDEFGAVPESLDAALAGGANAALFTPRGLNPTGASWSEQRLAELANVLAAYPEAVAIEDDQFAGVATTRPGSLLSDPRLENRTIYIRSFSKSIAPDLRIAVAVTRNVLHGQLADAKSFADGWTSRLLQRVLAGIFSDDELWPLLEHARDAYRARREGAAEAVNRILAPAGGGARCGADGVNIWVALPSGVDSKAVVERSAACGVRVADGEAFYLRPGHSGTIRLNAGSVPAESAARAGTILGQAALAGSRCNWPIHV